MKFLRARWEHLLLANYRVEPDVLAPLVPRGTQLDQFEGLTLVSLVAFLFRDTRVLGLPVPGYGQFEEVNLRFYVSPISHPSRRAVTFIKELVPRSIIPLVANTLFHENYQAVPMAHHIVLPDVAYSWTNAVSNSFRARIERDAEIPSPGSMAQFITEHYWGYAQGPRTTLEYRVEHSQWPCCLVEDFKIEVDFAATYGQAFAGLNGLRPHSVLYAPGSPVSVSFPGRLH